MRRHPLWAVTVLAALLAAGPASAGEVVGSGDRPGNRLDLNYILYFGGLHVLDLDIAVGLAATSYEVETHIRTVGFLHWATAWSLASETQGDVLENGLRLQPHRHRVNTQFRGRPRSVAIDFNSGEVADVRILPPPRDDEKAFQVPARLMRGTIDPTSALLAMTQRISAEQTCAGRIPVFDGRHRYDVIVAEKGSEELPRVDDAMFSGEARRCDFTFEPIAGFELPRAGSDEDARRRRFFGGRAWFAEMIPGRPAIPVRIQIDGEMASALVYLHSISNPAAAARNERN